MLPPKIGYLYQSLVGLRVSRALTAVTLIYYLTRLSNSAVHNAEVLRQRAFVSLSLLQTPSCTVFPVGAIPRLSHHDSFLPPT